jgi:ParB family transcriptional regulator, chromosome partitioning protein
LSALLGNSATGETRGTHSHHSGQQDQIHVDLIERNPFQPRQEFDSQGLKELADSIRQQGVLQSILVRPFEDRYQLIAGERRLLASKQAGLETIPCRVLDADDRTVCEIAIDENLKRRDLNVLEKARAFRDYLERFSCSVEELAGRLSLDRSTVSNMIRLLDLSEEARLALTENKITAGHARAMLALDEPGQQTLCRTIIKDGLSVRATERLVKEWSSQGSPEGVIPIDGAPVPAEKSSHVRSLEQQLQEQFGVKVNIRLKSATTGQVVLHFANNDDFERIVQTIRRAA